MPCDNFRPQSRCPTQIPASFLPAITQFVSHTDHTVKGREEERVHGGLLVPNVSYAYTVPLK